MCISDVAFAKYASSELDNSTYAKLSRFDPALILHRNLVSDNVSCVPLLLAANECQLLKAGGGRCSPAVKKLPLAAFLNA